MGTGAVAGIGNELANAITGNDADNTLRGGLGNDTLNGWGGDDTFYGDSGRDVFQFTSPHSADGDKIMDFVDGVDKLDFSKMDANGYQSGAPDWTFDGYRNSTSGSSGHLWAVEDGSAGVTHLYGNNGSYQFHIDLRGTGLGLSVSDFSL